MSALSGKVTPSGPIAMCLRPRTPWMERRRSQTNLKRIIKIILFLLINQLQKVNWNSSNDTILNLENLSSFQNNIIPKLSEQTFVGCENSKDHDMFVFAPEVCSE